MNYNELLDREIDMLVATRVAGWQLTEEGARDRSGAGIKWDRKDRWDDGSEQWLPYYTESFYDANEAAKYLLKTNERIFERLIGASISRFILDTTPRTLCILMLEALDAAAKGG